MVAGPAPRSLRASPRRRTLRFSSGEFIRSRERTARYLVGIAIGIDRRGKSRLTHPNALHQPENTDGARDPLPRPAVHPSRCSLFPIPYSLARPHPPTTRYVTPSTGAELGMVSSKRDCWSG